METATQSHLATLRNMLTYRLAELRAEVDAAEWATTPAGAAPLDADDVRDTKDAAARASDMQLQAAEAQRDADELALVKAALARLDAGTYGDCADCGEPIPLARLWVQPAAPRCAPCQAELESGHGHLR